MNKDILKTIPNDWLDEYNTPKVYDINIRVKRDLGWIVVSEILHLDKN